MTSLILVIIILGFPVFLGLFFRVASSHIFFSMMAGELLARYFGHDFEKIIQSVTLNDNLAAYGELIILITPMIMTAVILKGTMKRRHMFWQVVPLAITGVVFAAFVVPILPANMQETASQQQLGKYLVELDSAVIAIVICAQLVALWVQNRIAHSKNEKSHKK